MTDETRSILDDIRSELEQACGPIHIMYTDFVEQAKKASSESQLESTLNKYRIHGRYKVDVVHVGVSKPEFAHNVLLEIVLDYVNKKYKLDELDIFGKWGLNFVAGSKGIHNTDELEPLKNAVKEYEKIVSSEEFRIINDSLTHQLEEHKEEAIHLCIKQLKEHFGIH